MRDNSWNFCRFKKRTDETSGGVSRNMPLINHYEKKNLCTDSRLREVASEHLQNIENVEPLCVCFFELDERRDYFKNRILIVATDNRTRTMLSHVHRMSLNFQRETFTNYSNKADGKSPSYKINSDVNNLGNNQNSLCIMGGPSRHIARSVGFGEESNSVYAINNGCCDMSKIHTFEHMKACIITISSDLSISHLTSPHSLSHSIVVVVDVRTYTSYRVYIALIFTHHQNVSSWISQIAFIRLEILSSVGS